MAKRMLRFQQQGVETPIAVIPIKRDAVDDWVQHNASGGCGVIEVVVGRQVTRLAPLVSNRSHPLVTQIVFGSERVVEIIRGRNVGSQCGQVNTTSGREIVRSKRHNGIRI